MYQYLTFDIYINEDDLSKYDDSPAEKYTFYEVYIPNVLGPIFNMHHAIVVVELKDKRAITF